MPITTQLQGGLGNQLFQIANCIAHALRHNMEYMIPREKADHLKRPVCFTHFPPLTIPFNDFGFYRETSFTYKEIPRKEQICFIGYYQSWKYFWDVKEKVFEHIMPGFDVLGLKGMKKTDIVPVGSVAIHIRRGDYLDENFQNIFPSVGMDYIKKAVNFFTKKGYYSFSVYSDDIAWCKEAIRNDPEFGDRSFFFMEAKSKDPVKDDLFDFYTMSLHDHQIISNSTYSLWAAMLNTNPDKMIVCPHEDIFFGPQVPDLGDWYEKVPLTAIDLLPEDFIRIK